MVLQGKLIFAALAIYYILSINILYRDRHPDGLTLNK